jgi:hypothetical protein
MGWDGKEKRKFKRGDVYVRVFSVNPQGVLGAYTENFSAGGMRATFDQELPVDSVINLEIYLQEEPTMCKGKVVWIKKIDLPKQPGVYLYDTGIEFLK